MAKDQAEQSSQRELTAWLSIVLGQQLAACALYAAESVELFRLDASGFAGAAKQALVVLLSGGTALGVAIAVVEAARRAVEARARVARARVVASAAVFYAALAVPLLYWLGSELFSGAWISTQPYAPVGPPLVALLGAIGVAVALWAIAALAARSAGIAALALALLGVLFAFLDRLIAKDLYQYLHATLMLLCALALGGACRLLIARLIGSSQRRALSTAIPIVALSSAVAFVFTHRPHDGHRAFWDRHPNYAGRLYEGAREVVFMLRTRGVERGAYGRDVAVWSADQKQLRSPAENLGAWQARMDEARSVAARVERPFADDFKPHLLMITVDTLRADVAYESFERGSIAPIAQRGVVFRRAYAGAPSTRKSLPMLLSGRTDWRLQDQNIFGALEAAGYETAFVTEHVTVDWLKGIGQRWLTDPDSTLLAERSAEGWSSERITELAEQRLAEQRPDVPLFMWVHYFDLHEWQKLDQAVQGGDAMTSYRRTWSRVQEAIVKLSQTAQAKLGSDRLSIVIGADHGEYLGEMNRIHHARWVAPELIRVPLVLIVPGQAPREAFEPVGLIDVAPTLALLAGVSLPKADGIPLLSADVMAREQRPLASGGNYEIGIVLGAHRLVLDPSRNLVRLYDDSQGAKELRGDAHASLRNEMIGLMLGSPVAREDRSQVSPLQPD